MWVQYLFVVIACYIAFTAGVAFVIAQQRQQQGPYWNVIGRILFAVLTACVTVNVANL